MTDRLLTDEEIASIMNGPNDPAEDGFEEFWVPGDVFQTVSQAQDIKTLKAVGEWLEEMRTIHYEVVKAIDEGSFSDTEAARIQGRDGQAFFIVKRAFQAKWGDIDQLKQGKMS